MPKPTAKPRRHQPWLCLACLPAALLTACAGNPFAEEEGDLGKRVAMDRLRSVERLYIDKYRREAPGGTGVPAPTPAANGAASQRASAPIDPLTAQAGRMTDRPTVPLSIEHARASVLTNNLDLQVALVDPSIAGESLNAERAKFEAVFRPFVDYTNNAQNLTSLNTTDTNQLRFGTGVDIPLRTGGRASVDLVQSRSNVDAPPGFTDTVYGSGIEFSIAQPLLRNAGRDVNVASIRIASYNEQIAETRTKLAVINALAAVERSYWLLYAVRRELDVRQQQYELAREQLARAQRRVRAQQAPEIEETRAESGVAERLDGIIQAENAVLIRQRELKRLMNDPAIDLGGGALLTPQTEPSPMDFLLDAPALVELALAGRMELLETELALLTDAVNIDVTKNQTLPALDATARVGLSGTDPQCGEAQRDFFQGQYTSFALGLSAEVPLGNDAALANARQAVLIRLQRLSSLEARKLLVRQEVLDAVDRLTANWQRVLASRQATILAGRTLRGEQRQFDAGARTSTDVLDAASKLAEAQSAEIRALTEYQIAQVDLAVATGTVLGGANVDWRPIGGPAPTGR